jgi:hypothetical protein
MAAASLIESTGGSDVEAQVAAIGSMAAPRERRNAVERVSAGC